MVNTRSSIFDHNSEKKGKNFKQKQTTMANPEGSSRGSRWSLKGTTALVTGGTRGIGFLFFASHSPFLALSFYFVLFVACIGLGFLILGFVKTT